MKSSSGTLYMLVGFVNGDNHHHLYAVDIPDDPDSLTPSLLLPVEFQAYEFSYTLISR